MPDIQRQNVLKIYSLSVVMTYAQSRAKNKCYLKVLKHFNFTLCILLLELHESSSCSTFITMYLTLDDRTFSNEIRSDLPFRTFINN